jgi:hypothetical protein
VGILLPNLVTRRAGFWMPIVMMFMIVCAAGAFPFFRSRPQNRVIMSMQPRPWPEVPASTAKVAKKAFRKGSLAIRARDELGSWYEDAGFSAVYGVRGKPGISPAQLAMVTVLQFTENLTDRQAADAVRVGADDRVDGRSGLASCRHQPQYERSEDQLHCQLHLPARHDDDVRP